ncbi:glycoside hydrolase family 3 protein [Apodospora peruviana]|uniref:xylan 1,4-beta-xylosidase n=1 Tax=Apodospora peruviana TaxID=516989 RepID=A0AAE0LY69_9PEZI|nr:glycoside hydrolase family 3 protein [Apodospora peruviana]
MALSFAGLLIAVLALPPSANAGVKYPECKSGPLKSNVVCDTKASPEARASALVAAMSNSDKLANLVNNSPGFSKLGMSAYQWWNEALHGVAHNRGISWGGQFSAATQFPQAITTGASFDDDLVGQMGIIISTEARAFANAGRAHLDFWTPDVNPFRDPRWGRGHETPGEDPFRNSKWAEAFVRGMQGTGPTHRVVATCKHFAAYDLENAGSTTRFNFNAKVSTQDLVEYYLPPFRQCARDSKVGSIMCSYNAVNGVPACANEYLMDTILRKHWNWTDDNQYVVSDCDAVYYLGNANGGHRYKSSYSAAIGAALEAGCDNMCWATDGTQPNAASAFNSKAFSQATLDKAMLRQYQGLIRAGYFDGPDSLYRSLGAADVNTPFARETALRAAQEGIVLLKNDDGFLPIAQNSSLSVAMIGFWANAADKMLGGYSGSPPFKHDPVTAAKAMGITVTYVNGPLTQSSADSSAAVSAAQKSNVILFFGGIDNTVEKESQDRTSISWPAGQLSMIQKLAAVGKPVVVIKMGTHVDDTPILSLPNVKSILWVGYPGQDGGTAVMNIIAGLAAPAGRLPITMYPSSYTSQAPQTNMALRPSGTYPGRTYRWYKDPVFPFGHGLHYTTFSISPDTAYPAKFSIQDVLADCTKVTGRTYYMDLCPFPSIPITVTNTGSRTSDFVVLGFLTGMYGPAPYPIKTLATYKRLFNVTASQPGTAKLDWNLGSLARVDEKGNTVLYPGTYTLLLDQPTKVNVTFVLEGREEVLDKWPEPPS